MFQSAAIVVQEQFGRKLAGEYGATKLSLSVLPFMTLSVPTNLRPDDFRPRPKVPTAILHVRRREESKLDWSDRRLYWLFVNYLFEQGRPAVADSIRPLGLRRLPPSLKHAAVRDLRVQDVVTLFEYVRARGQTGIDKLAAFDRSIALRRRLTIGPTAKPQ